ncbi:MAG TPA: hypothetical protein VIV11_02390 [Kofleriaceae bacterium]
MLRRLHLRTTPRYWVIGLALWLPMIIGEALRAAAGLRVDPFVHDMSLHVRFLFALPVLMIAEQLLETTTQSGIRSFYNGRFCAREPVDRILAHAARLRDSWLVEAGLLAVGIVGGQLVLWGVFGSTGLFHGGAAIGGWTFPRVWYAAVALPLVQFVMFRWLWRWVIWTYVLAKLSRLPLTPISTHPDLAAGLAGLARPVTGFAGFMLAMSAILSSAFGTQILEGGTPLHAVLPGLTTFLVLGSALALVPLLAFSGLLFRTRRRTLAQYGDFARDYTLRFHEKWLVRPDRLHMLGTPDIQSLNDLGGAYSVIGRSRVFVFGPRNVLTLWVAGLAPMLPLLASNLTLDQILNRIIRTVLGGLPF